MNSIEHTTAGRVPNLPTKSAIFLVKSLTDSDALDFALAMEEAFSGRSAVMDAIAKRRTEIRKAGAA